MFAYNEVRFNHIIIRKMNKYIFKTHFLHNNNGRKKICMYSKRILFHTKNLFCTIESLFYTIFS